MSYDLFFKPQETSLSLTDFHRYFRERPRFTFEGVQACYHNEDTGVYFTFEFKPEQRLEDGDDGEFFPVAFNINYFRPSYFALEAEPEVAAFVRYFGLLVHDPQAHGMGTGKYDTEKFLSGWHHGNQFGYSAILQDEENRKGISHLPTDQLHDAWRWNLSIPGRQSRAGESKFVPRVIFLNLGDSTMTVTAAVWPDGIPVVVTKVDYLYIPRDDLAPRKMFRKQKDRTFVPWEIALPILLKHGVQNEHGTVTLNYVKTPRALAKFVRSLPADSRPITILSADKVLDRELYERSIA